MLKSKGARRAIVSFLIVPSCVPGVTFAQNFPITPDKTVKGAQPVVGVNGGVPVIQVSPPVAGGVSHNKFTHFNVGPAGVVLNNSGGSSVTQIAGSVAGNPLLGNKHAKILLNEVTSTHPTQMKGALEVAGHRAHVIVANPAGITCDGCGFLNAQRITLTTGRPEIGPKGDIAFNVATGKLTIDGEGLNGTQSAQVDLLARALVVNAGVWTDRLNVVTGPSKVDATGQHTQTLEGQGGTPKVALDTSALGGMYANSIRLIGTEAGVGVNVAGNLVAMTGDLTLSAAGNIRFAPKVTISAKEKLALQTPQGIHASDTNLHGRNVSIKAKALDNQRGSLTALNTLTAQVEGSVQNKGGLIAATGNQHIQAGSLYNDSGTLAGGNLSLISHAGVSNRQGVILADESLKLNAKKLVNQNTLGTTASAGISANTVSLAVEHVDNTKGTIQARTNLALTAGELRNASGLIAAQNNTKVQANALMNRHGTISAGQQLTVGIQQFDRLGWLQSGADLSFSLPGSLTPNGNFIAGRDLKLDVGNSLIMKSRLSAGRDVVVKADALEVTSTGEVLGGRHVKLDIAKHVGNAGVIDAQSTRIHAATLHNQGRIYGDSVTVVTDYLVNDAGPKKSAVIASRGGLNLAVGSLENRNHSVLYAQTDLKLGRTLTKQNAIQGDAQYLLNRSSTIEAGKSIVLSARQIHNHNANFEWGVERVSSQPKVFFTPEGSTEKYDAATHWLCDRVTRECSRDPAWLNDDPDRRFLLPSKQYPESRYGPHFDYAPLGRGYAGYSAPVALSYTPATSSGYEMPEQFRYARDARVWSVFGVEPPKYDLPHQAQQNSWSEWPTAQARQPEYEHYKERHLALDERIKAFNRDFKQRLVKHFTVYEVNENVWQFRTLRSDPARIISGGSITLKGAMTNDKSHIAATGKLSVNGPAIHNLGATGWRTTFHEGQATFTQAREHDRKAHRAPYKVTVKSEPFDLPVGTVRTVSPRKVNLPERLDTSQMYGTLLAGQHTYLHSQGNVLNSGTIGAAQTMQVNALNIVNHSGGLIQANRVYLHARDSLKNIAARIYGNTVALSAGQSIHLISTKGVEQHETTQGTFSAGESLVKADDLMMQAGLDISMLSAKVIAERDAKLKAGRDIKVSGLTMQHQEVISSGRHQHHQVTTKKVAGSAATAKRDLSLTAGQDITLKAAEIRAERELQLQAGRDAQVLAETETGQAKDKHREKSGGFLSSKTAHSETTHTWQQAQGSLLTGQNIGVTAGRDVKVEGSNVGAKRNLDIAAQGNVDIQPGKKQATSHHIEKVKKSGLGAAGSMSIGKRKTTHTSKEKSAGNQASTVGSLAGNTQIEAERLVNIIASQVVAAEGDVSIRGDTVNIAAAKNRHQRTDTFDMKMSGVSVGAKIAALEAYASSANVLDHLAGGKVDDPLIASLGLAAVGMATSDVVDQITQAIKNGESLADLVGAIQLNIQLGTTKQSSKSVLDVLMHTESTVAAGNNVDIKAKGKGKKSHIHIDASKVSAKGEVALEAEGEIHLQSQSDTITKKFDSKGSSAALGVGVSIGKDGVNLAGGQASASAQKGRSRSTETKTVHTEISAGKKAVLKSGSDTKIKGAIVSGGAVQANIDGNLSIESVQDTASYQGTHKGVAGSVSVGTGLAGSASVSANKVKGDYKAVREQSGMQAGDGGFDIAVKGNTDLKGASIVSTEAAVKAERNRVATETLTTSDIKNYSQYKAQGIAMHGSAMSAPKGIEAKKDEVSTTAESSEKKDSAQEKSFKGAVAPGVSTKSGKKSTTTRSGVSGAAVVINNLEAQRKLTGETATLLLSKLDASLRTGVTSGHLKKEWNPEKLRATVAAEAEVLSAFTQQASKVIDSYVSEKRADLRQRSLSANDKEKEEIEQKINSLNTHERVLNVIVGGLSGSLPIATAHAAISQAADEMRQYTIADSRKFLGVTDGVTYLDNKSGISAGIRGDAFKAAGVRVELDTICGVKNERCKHKSDTYGNVVVGKNGLPELYTDENGRVVFDAEQVGISLEKYITTGGGVSMNGPTGGVQGRIGTLMGMPYQPGGIIDFIHEAFSGPHDFIGGTLSGLYDDKGNAQRGRSYAVRTAHNTWSVIALAPAAPFAFSEILPSEVWVAIDILLKIAK